MNKFKLFLILILLNISLIKTFIFDIPTDYYTVENTPKINLTNNDSYYRDTKFTFNIVEFIQSLDMIPSAVLPMITPVQIFLEDFNFGNTQTELLYNSQEIILDDNNGVWQAIMMNFPGAPIAPFITYEIKGFGSYVNLRGDDPRITMRIGLNNGDLMVLTYRFKIKPYEINRPIEYNFNPQNALQNGCLTLKFESLTKMIDSEDYIFFKSMNYGNNHNMFEKKICEIYMDDDVVAKTDVCTFGNDKDITINNIFDGEKDYSFIIIKFCQIVTPPNFDNYIAGSSNVFSFKINTKNDFTFLFNERILLKSSKPIITKKVDIVFNKKIVNSEFELKLTPEFDCVKFSIPNFQIKINLPDEYIILVPKINVEFINNSTGRKKNFYNIKVTDSYYIIDVFNEEIDPEKSFSVIINGFLIPDIVGDLKMKVSLFDLLKESESQDWETIIRIAEPIYINFSIFPHLDENLKIKLSNNNLGETTNCEIQANINHNNYDKDLVNLIIHFNDSLEIKKDFFVGITDPLNFIYNGYEINEEKNILKINQVKLNNYDDKTYIKFELKGLKTKIIDYDQLEIKIEALDGEKQIYVASHYIYLNPLKLNFKNEKFQIIDEIINSKKSQLIGEEDEKREYKKFLYSIEISMNKNISFDHFLRLNLSRAFVIESGTNCVNNLTFPNFEKNDFKCKTGKFTNYDKSHFRQNIILENILKFSQPGVFYKLEFGGYLEEYIERQNKIVIDIIPFLENEEEFNNYQLQTDKKISDLYTADIILDCPLSCTKCEISTKKPLICYECNKNLNLEIDLNNNICIKQKTKEEEPIIDTEKPIIENKIDINDNKLNKSFKEKVYKIFSGIFFSFYSTGLILMCYLKLLYDVTFKEFVFLASIYTFVHYFLTYILLIYSINTMSSVELNLMIIIILIFLLSNAIFSLGTFAKGKNKVMENVKIFNIRSNHMLFNFIYCIFGSGIALWVSIFQFSNIYSKLLIDDYQVKKFKKLYKIILYFNLIFVMAITLAIAVVFFTFANDFNKLIYYYIASGVICTFVYFVLVLKDKKNLDFSNTGFSTQKKDMKIIDHFGKSFDKYSEVTDDEFFNSLDDGDIKNLFMKFKEFGNSI